MASQEIETLASALSRLPGLGPRSARRAVLWLVKRRDTALPAIVAALEEVSRTLIECNICRNIDTRDPCGICADPRRDGRSICVVEEVADLWALDRAKLFTGTYHVLGRQAIGAGWGATRRSCGGQLARAFAARWRGRGGAGHERHAGGADDGALSGRADRGFSRTDHPVGARPASRGRTGLSGRRHLGAGVASTAAGGMSVLK